MPSFATSLFTAVVLATSIPAMAGGFVFSGPGTPLPRPANPHNNPWLNFPTHYGSGAPTHNFTEAVTPDKLANMDRFMALSETARINTMRDAEHTSLARGQALFNDTRLGSNGLNCAACHPNGGSAGGKVGMGAHEIAIPSLIGVAQRYPRFNALNGRVITQTEMQNNCLSMFLKGQPLATGTQEAADLTYYVGQFRTRP